MSVWTRMCGQQHKESALSNVLGQHLKVNLKVNRKKSQVINQLSGGGK